ncbi:HARB1 nuclease, partial [Amia calva]|nr:HARB1 nuclease [Amia calva]
MFLCSYVLNATRRSNAFTGEQTVCLALRYFASGHFVYSIGDAEHLGKNIVCRAVRKVVLALSKLLDAFVVFPGHLSILKIKEAFYGIAGIPRVIGVIDCTHIPISSWENMRGIIMLKWHEFLCQMTCDHHLMVTSLEARWPGSVHDSRIFWESTLGQRFEQGHFDGLLLGERGYSCLCYLMTPYPQIKYNVAHSNTSTCKHFVTFGVIKACFACLQRLRVRVEWACEVVATCVVLHNIATIRKEIAPCQLPMPPDVVDHLTGRAVREAITNQFFNQ